MFRNKSVDVHQFAMVPRADIPRSTFRIQTTHKTTFDASKLVPVYVDEVLPGDSFRVKMTAFCRMATPLYPIMDNLHLDSFFFFVPCRLIWQNWKKFMGEQADPSDSISYTIPKMVSPIGGYPVGSVFDYMGLPTVGQVGATATFEHSALPLRAYARIYQEWFRDENLVGGVAQLIGDGPDLPSAYSLYRRGKRHDYFTSCLPWPQKGTPVTMPLGTTAPVTYVAPNGTAAALRDATTGAIMTAGAVSAAGSGSMQTGTTPSFLDPNGTLIADLSAATAATINQLRQSFQVQKLLERDARGGTRYVELLRSHFGVVSPDFRLARPEFLGGGSTMINVNPIAQTSATGIQGGTTPQGTLGAMATAVVPGHGFAQSFTEHGYVIGIVSVRADLTYQQGLRRMWSRKTRYDFYFPAFAALGEQAVLNQEIYCTGNVDATDGNVFGYQERWAEYRYHPSMITSKFRSTSTGTLDAWHLAQRFSALPTLGTAFIEENVPLSRVLAAGDQADGQQIIFDSFFDIVAARPMPMYSVPGMIDHF